MCTISFDKKLGKEILNIPKEFLTIENLLKNNFILDTSVSTGTLDLQRSPCILHDCFLQLKLSFNVKIRETYENIIREYPELTNVINNKNICFGEINMTDRYILISLLWIYSQYYGYSVLLFLPKFILGCLDTFISEFNSRFNEQMTIDNLNNVKIINSDLESLEMFEKNIKENANGTNKIASIFGYSDFILSDLYRINHRRLNTQLNKIIKKSHCFNALSVSSLKIFNLKCFEDMDLYELKSKPSINLSNLMDSISILDLIDSDVDNMNLNIESLIESIIDYSKENKRVYLCLNLESNILKHIEKKLLENSVSVSRKEDLNSHVVINSYKSAINNFLIHSYQVYIVIGPKILEPIDIIPYLKLINNEECHILFDSSKIKNIEKNIEKLIISNGAEYSNDKLTIYDSNEFKSYKECKETLIKNIPDAEPIQATDYYFSFDAPESINKLDLTNIPRNEYDNIRNVVKLKLLNKYDIDAKTCQLSTPCSPKDRSKKLNSLSNKISSFDYRCHVTCELFKNYSIGVLVWNDFFSNRKSLDLASLKKQTYIYQTTSGNWKYSAIS